MKPTRKKPPAAKRRDALFRMTFAVLVVGVLLALDLVLRMAGYGAATRLFVHHPLLRSVRVENMPYYNRYFDKNLWVSPAAKNKMIRTVFTDKKAPGTLRGFVLGESAAQGYPYNSNQAFSGMLQAALSVSGKYSRVEVINVGDSAISSYAVRDIARRLSAYEPDFLVLYVGNNEYYGTLSESTGGSHFSRNLYLRLRDDALFDWVSGALAGTGDRRSETLMAARFAQKRYPPNDAVDDRVARNFVRNIDAIVSQYAPSIPVVLVEPVANLEMPPFGSIGDADLKDLISAYHLAVRTKDALRAREVHAERLHTPVGQSATIRYLDGMCQRLLDPRNRNDSDLLTARDLDTIPFRPKSTELKALHDYATGRAQSLPNLHFVALGDRLRQRYGPAVFGRAIFLDHVHFNQQGHRLVAEAIADTLAPALSLDHDQSARVRAFADDENAVMNAVHSVPYYRVHASIVLDPVFQSPPFSTMTIPYVPTHEEAERALQEMGLDLTMQVSEKSRGDALAAIHEYYMAHGAPGMAYEYLAAEQFSFPGWYKPYLDIARLAAKYDDKTPVAQRNYVFAYLLSDSDKTAEIRQEMDAFFAKKGRPATPESAWGDLVP